MLLSNGIAVLRGCLVALVLMGSTGVSAQALLSAESGQLRAARIIEFLAVAPSASSSDSQSPSGERGIAGVRKSHAVRQDTLLSNAKPAQSVAPAKRKGQTQPSLAVNKPSLFLARQRPGRNQIRFDNVPFETQSFSIPYGAYAQLDEIGVALSTLTTRFPDTQFILESYAGGGGSVEADKETSTRRAKAIKRFLVARFALDADRFAVVGLGSDQRNLGVKTTNVDELNKVIQLVRIL